MCLLMWVSEESVVAGARCTAAMTALRDPHRLTLLCLIALQLGVGACGGSSPKPAGAAPPTHKYVATLSGNAAPRGGARGGRGLAVIALRVPSHQLCWRFADLHGFTEATAASIDADRTGTTIVALSMAPRLHHRGCVSANAALLRAIATDPSACVVRVRSITYPEAHGARVAPA